MFSTQDDEWMRQALMLAAQGLWTTTPNPRVGCVVVRGSECVGQGWHRRAGEPHAEVLALAQAGERAKGATAYVSLEPCCHFGRTPPCTDALIAAGVTRVVVAMEDPNPRVGGRGLERLRDAGIDVRCGLRAKDAWALNPGFASRMTRGRPWVRAKLASTLDGHTALQNGVSQWITGPEARADGHRWRARACAILTGIGTIRDDDPELTVRAVETERQPQRVIIDSRLEISLDAKVLRSGALVFCAAHNPGKERELADRGCEVVCLPNASGKVDLAAMLMNLAERGFNEIHVEAGAALTGSFIREGCLDELLVYMAPRLVGAGAGLVNIPTVDQLGDPLAWAFVETALIGTDLRVLMRHVESQSEADHSLRVAGAPMVR